MGAVSQPVKRHIYSVNKYLSLQAQTMSNELSETLVCLLQRAGDFVIFLKLCKLKFISQMPNKCLVFDHKMYGLCVTDCSEHGAFRDFIPSLLMQLFFLPWASFLLQWCGEAIVSSSAQSKPLAFFQETGRDITSWYHCTSQGI